VALATTVIAVTSDGITVSAVYNNAAGDGEIHSVKCVNNSPRDTLLWAVYQGTFQSLPVPAGQTVTQNLPGNIAPGDVTGQVGFG
jgi:hypothetical protein